MKNVKLQVSELKTAHFLDFYFSIYSPFTIQNFIPFSNSSLGSQPPILLSECSM